jgi:hypothetical protein
MTVSAPRSTFAVIVMLATFAITSQRVGRPSEIGTASPIGALRAITSGEQSYAASMNGGAFDTPDCLLSGACVPGERAASGFLSPDLANLRDYRGYRLDFYAGPPAEPRPGITRSPSSMSRYAVVAVPLPSQPATLRRFCVDDRGIIYQIATGTPRVEDGRCLDTATPVQ